MKSRSHSNVHVNYLSVDIHPNVRSSHENQRPECVDLIFTLETMLRIVIHGALFEIQ